MDGYSCSVKGRGKIMCDNFVAFTSFKKLLEITSAGAGTSLEDMLRVVTQAFVLKKYSRVACY